MDGETLQGRWHEVKGMVVECWGRVTRNPRARVTGRRDRLVGRLEVSLAHSRLAALSVLPVRKSRGSR